MGLDMAISQGGNVFLHEKKKKGKREKNNCRWWDLICWLSKIVTKTALQQIVGKKSMLVD